MATPNSSSPPKPQRLDPAEVRRLLQWQPNVVPPEPPRRGEIEAALSAVLPEEVAVEVMGLARPAIGLWPQRPDKRFAPTVTQFGGMPNVPRDFAWPMEDGEPFLFLASIDCAGLHGLPGSDQLPSSGILAFFADSNGVTALEFGVGNVCHWPNVDDLVPATPEQAPNEILPLAGIAFRPFLDLPDQWSAALAPILSDREVRDRYAAIKSALRNRGIPEDEQYYCGFTKLLGWPSLLQWHDLDAIETEPASRDIRLLLQLDMYANGTERVDWGGTGGSLYFTIANADLAAARFANCDFDRQFT